jgi:hypothetical protein
LTGVGVGASLEGMRAVQLAALALLAACGEAPAVAQPDVDAGPVDAAVDAPVDAMACPAPPDEPSFPGQQPPPVGLFRGGWQCLTPAGCPERPTNEILDATEVTVLEDGVMHFRNGLQDEVATIPGRVAGPCWRAPRDLVTCTTSFDFCRTGAGGGGALELERYDFATATWHRWRFAGG